MPRFIREFVRDTKGAAAIEYGLIVALISVVMISALTQIGLQLQAVFANIADTLHTANY
jgi:pilus assembly protein Flp/PilA